MDKKINKISLILFFFIMLLVVVVHLVFTFCEGRVLLDHDAYFYDYSFSMDQADYFENWYSSTFTPSFKSFYFLNNFLVTLLDQLVCTIDLPLLRLLNLPFFFILILGAYLLGTFLSDRTVGLLSATIVATLPIFDNFSRSFTFHFHVSGPIVLANALAVRIIRTHRSWGNFVALGLVCALATLIHPIALGLNAILYLFLFGFLVYQKNLSWSLAGKFGLSLLLYCLMSFPVWNVLPSYFIEKQSYFYVIDRQVFSLIDFTPEWAWFVFKIFFGSWYSLLFLALIGGSILLGALKRTTPSQLYLVAISLSYLSTGLFIALRDGNITDLMVFNALVPPLLLSFFVNNLKQWRNGRHILLILVLVIFLIGGIAKARNLAPVDNVFTESHSYITTFRRIIVKPDWTKVIHHILAERPKTAAFPLCLKITRLEKENVEKNDAHQAKYLKTCLKLLRWPVELSCASEQTPINIEIVLTTQPLPAKVLSGYLREQFVAQPDNWPLTTWEYLDRTKTGGFSDNPALIIVRFPTPAPPNGQENPFANGLI